jgi:hypothetical protein
LTLKEKLFHKKYCMIRAKNYENKRRKKINEKTDIVVK